jgi:hypothetical protein
MANSPYTLFSLPAAGPSLTAGTAASMLIAASPAVGQVRPTIPANWIGYGTRVTFDATGIITTAASSPGTGTWDVRFGSVIVATSTGPTFPTSMSSWKWQLHHDITCRSVGATTAATMFGATGYLMYGATASTDTVLQLPYNVNPPVAGTGFDSTVPNVFDAFFTESVATATFVCETACAVIWNPQY